MSKEKPKANKSIYKPKAISGFPEWLPEERLVEQQWLDHIRKVFESYGFCSIETPSVEKIDVLLAKGAVDKEIYVLERLHKDEDSDSSNSRDSRLALHFDQTVPFARYTAQHFNELVFPFKRYQIQRVWRGERPQMGRMREFTQCDIDVINVDNLPLAFDAEIPAMIYEVLDGLNIGRVQLRISNRKILMGIMEYTGVDCLDTKTNIFRIIDKFEKLSLSDFNTELEKVCPNEKVYEAINHALKWAVHLKEIFETESNVTVQTDFLKSDIKNTDFYNNPTFAEGIDELIFVIESLEHLPFGAVVADLSIVRGLDYYTGTVYETQLLDVPEFTGSVCSGGRYDDLAGSFINKHLPGVGISIGFSRLFDVIRQSRPEMMNIGAKSPADILLYTEDKDLSNIATQTAQILRGRGHNVEIYHTVKKWDKHFKYAQKKQIPLIWYVKSEHDHEIKDMATGDQSKVDPETWKKN